MTNFLSTDEKKASSTFEKYGYFIYQVIDKRSLTKIREIFVKSIKKNLNKKTITDDDQLLNQIHNNIKSSNLNNFRLKIINDINKNKKIRELYYKIAKPGLDILLGNEVAMQLRINLSIQLPKDKSSLLPLHSDVWSGDSPYETVVWIPLVDCYKTKSMYILPPNKYSIIEKIFKNNNEISSKKIFSKIKKHLKWIDIKYGEVLIFNQFLPHGNVINKEKETRWSLNCRFKNIFSPYKDKKLGEFFEPVTMRKITMLANKYSLPKIK